MTKIKLRFFIVCFLALTITDCKDRTFLSKEEYLTYFNTNAPDLSKEKELNSVSYKVKIQIPEFICINNNRSIETISEYEKEFMEFKNQLNFVMVIEDLKESKLVKELIYSKEEYSKLVRYANIELINDFKLLQGQDTLPCTLIHLEQSNPAHPVIRLAIGFSNVKENDKNYTLLFNDNFFNNGLVKYRFDESTFKNLPKLKF